MDAAGTVDIAPHGGDLEIGDRVPAAMSLAKASTIPMNAMTAHLALAELALKPDATLAVSGGAGVLASYLIAMAHHRGIRVVADAKAADTELVRGFGADDIVERGEEFAARVREAYPDGVDAAVDGAVMGASILGAVRDGGQALFVRPDAPKGERGIRSELILVASYAKNQQALLEIVSLAEQGVLQPRVAAEFELSDAATAHARFEAGGVRGRFVLKLDDQPAEAMANS
jgi:NADPH:quinone reductase-like Zn-dependent oxidoreductase